MLLKCPRRRGSRKTAAGCMEPLSAASAPKQAHSEQAHQTAACEHFVEDLSAGVKDAVQCRGSADQGMAYGGDDTPDAVTVRKGSEANASAALADGDLSAPC